MSQSKDVTLADVLNAIQHVGAKVDSMEKRLTVRIEKLEEGQQTIIQAVNELKDDLAAQKKELTQTSKATAYLSRDVLILKNEQ
ncbi:hypothetical protein H1164_11060 [Thermoactinomyces daqus]|uniref:Uncharacterized protein n=1 Tax=Thermoactinomyces daqus TaxID=1329516 RepID=A0A7W2AIN0_9BACL|nr:hypothetical protein [Thermoactinomyces daqus]MBA4543435.1 hypothetical protein [Thermoactinomyces daqus]